VNRLVYVILFITSFCFAQNDSLQPKDSVMYDVLEIESKEFDSNFKEKYDSNEFKYEAKIVNKNLSAWDRFLKSIRDFFSSLFDSRDQEGNITAFGIFMRVLAFLIIAFVIYMIIKIIIKKEGGWIFGKSSNKIKISELVEENIHTTDFHKLIQNAKNDNEYRTSIRYYYLWLLKSFSDKQIIEWDIEKTNSDYYYEIKNESKKSEFQFLSYIYEYCWYGEFEINQTDFEKAEKSFLKAIQQS
jgi:large-conductance mechanosensitive channel